MTMILPSSLYLLGVHINIVLTADRPDVWGEWDSETNTIIINSSAPEEKQCVTLLHELIHAMDDLLGMNLKHSSVYAVSQLLYVLLKDNPEIKEWIFEVLRTTEST